MRALLTLFLVMWVVAASAFEFPEFAGWQRIMPVERYDPENLFEYINGAAESYHSFGFQGLEVAEYQSGEAAVLVEVYRHASKADAFGIYAQERPRGGPFLDIGYQGYRSGDIFCMVASEYYIKLIGSRLGEDPSAVLEDFAGGLEKSIPEAKAAPDLLTLFPGDSLISHSEAYIARNFLGYAFFEGAFTADYPGFRLFIMKYGSPAAAAEVLQEYARKLAVPIPADSSGATLLEDPYHGRIYVSWRRNYIWGAFDMRGGSGEAYAEQIGINLKSLKVQ